MNARHANVSMSMKPMLAMILALGTATAAVSDTPAALADTATQAAEIESCIRGLADESFRAREQASRRLWELGEAALPALKEASMAADPEQAIRARALLRNIRLHITPDTDPGLIELIERYGKSSASEKKALLIKMRGKRAWPQMLKLYAAEKDPEVRREMRATMSAVALRAARERLMEDDSAGARKFLEMAPADPGSLLALAELHRIEGSLADEIARALAAPKPNAAWLLALRRAEGDPAKARDAALAAKEPRLAALMAALAGDPLPWLGELRGTADDDTPGWHYAVIAAKRWSGHKIGPVDLAPLMRMSASRDPDERNGAINALFLAGESVAAEKARRQHDPLAAFAYFDTLERVPEALEALGLDASSRTYRPWVDARIDELLADDIEDQHEVADTADELVVLANLLERRGRRDLLDQAFAAPLARMAAKDDIGFTELLGRMFGGSMAASGAPGLASRSASAWAGEDEARWSEVLVAAFGDEPLVRQWWDWLGEIQPRATRAERLDAMLALFRMGSNPGRLRSKWIELLWQAVEQAPPDRQAELVERIARLASAAGDAATAVKAWDRLPPADREKFYWPRRVTRLTATGRWQEAADVILAHIAGFQAGDRESITELHAYAAAALRVAGRPDEAAYHDRRAALLALGNGALAIRIGNGYAFGCDYQRAGEWWQRAAIWTSPDSDDCVIALKLHADELQARGQWTACAAVAEVLAAIYSTNEYYWSKPITAPNQRLQADMARGFSLLPRDRPRALALLGGCHARCPSDGSLADYFFPQLRKNGLKREHDRWFRETWQQLEHALAEYPDSTNTLNTAAWFAARSLRKLDQAEKLVRRALSQQPEQAAYLDTLAEIHFARGDRRAANEWSAKAVNQAPDDIQLRRQQQRFLSGPLPE